MLRDPRRPRDAVVETIVEEQRIVRIFAEALLDISRRERPSRARMTGFTRPAIPAEGFLPKQPFAVLSGPLSTDDGGPDWHDRQQDRG